MADGYSSIAFPTNQVVQLRDDAFNNAADKAKLLAKNVTITTDAGGAWTWPALPTPSISLLTAVISGTSWVSSAGSTNDLVLGSVGAERMRIQAADPGVKFATGTKIGFYGVTPVARQTATDLATLLTAMQNLGLIN